MYYRSLKNYFYDILSLKNIITDIEPIVLNNQEKIGVNPYIIMILYEIICNTVIKSK